MKDMSYRDKMVILVLSLVIIMIAGFFALIKPAYNKLVTDTATYEDTKTEWEGIKAKLDAIPGLKDEITKTYDTSKKDASVLMNTAFGDVNKDYDDKKVNYGLDQYLHQVIDDNSLAISDLSISGTSSGAIEYSTYTPNIVTYALLESGDLNGKYAQDISKLLEKQAVLKERKTATVMKNGITMSLKGKREDLMNFIDTIKEDSNAINITSLDIANYAFNDGTSREVTDEEGNVTVVANPNAEGTSELNIVMDFFNAKELDKPDLGD
jgi:Tfp pilus assembly protein PilO